MTEWTWTDVVLVAVVVIWLMTVAFPWLGPKWRSNLLLSSVREVRNKAFIQEERVKNYSLFPPVGFYFGLDEGAGREPRPSWSF